MKLISFKLLTLFFTVLLLIGCGEEEKAIDYSNLGVGVSKRTVAYLKGEKLDLSSELDPSQVPEIVKESYLEAAQLNKKGKEIIKYVIQDVSQKVASISSIDLNKDDVPDPILIVPEGNEESMTYSIRIPDPDKVKNYPDDANAWQEIAEKRSIEVLSVTVFPRVGQNKDVSFDVEARPNKQVYESHHHHHYHSSFLSTYFTYRMMSSLFFNPWYGGWYGPGFYGGMGFYSPGYYGNNYGARNVSSTKTTRRTYKKSPASANAMKTNSGKAVKSSKHNQRSSSVSNYKNSAIKKRNNAVAARKASGFGGAKKKSSSSGWGRSLNRSSYSGGGSRSWGK